MQHEKKFFSSFLFPFFSGNVPFRMRATRMRQGLLIFQEIVW